MVRLLKKIRLFYLINDLLNLIKINFKGYFYSKRKMTFIEVPRSSTTYICKIISKNLKKKSLFIPNSHYLKPRYIYLNKYFISLRDPTERFVSAYYHLRDGQRITYYNDFFIKFPTIDILAEKIEKKETRNYLRLSHHLHEGLSSFLSIKTLKKNKPFFIINHDNIKDDLNIFFNKIFKKKINIPDFDKKKISTNKKLIQKKTFLKIKKYLIDDYKIYYELKKIRKNILKSLK